MTLPETLPSLFIVYFRSFRMTNISTILTRNDKCIDGVLGTRTRGGGRMVSADESTSYSGTSFTSKTGGQLCSDNSPYIKEES